MSVFIRQNLHFYRGESWFVVPGQKVFQLSDIIYSFEHQQWKSILNFFGMVAESLSNRTIASISQLLQFRVFLHPTLHQVENSSLAAQHLPQIFHLVPLVYGTQDPNLLSQVGPNCFAQAIQVHTLNFIV